MARSIYVPHDKPGTVKRRRQDRAKTKTNFMVFNMDAGTFHEAMEVKYDLHHRGPRLEKPTQVNPNPYTNSRIRVDGKKMLTAAVAWLYTGASTDEELITFWDGPWHTIRYERLKRNNEPSIFRTTRFRHKDGNKLNNRRDNLEIVTSKPHQAMTWIAGTRVCLGSYDTKDEAVAAVNAARAAVGMAPVKTRNRNRKEN